MKSIAYFLIGLTAFSLFCWFCSAAIKSQDEYYAACDKSFGYQPTVSQLYR